MTGASRRTAVLRNLIVAAAVVASSGCGVRAGGDVLAVTSSRASPTGSPGVPIAVVLLHCGLQPVTVAGRVWEAPPQAVDGDPMLPLDATNQPRDWVGRGTAAVAGDAMTYTDEGGEVVDFVPDDGGPAAPCA